MADDPTVRLSLQRSRECPTCGNNTQPEEKECSLCGTILPQAVLTPVPAPAGLAPTIAVPPPVQTPEAPVVAPAARKPAGAQEETVKVARAEPIPPPSVPQSKPASSPIVKPTPIAPPRPVEPAITLPPPQVQANPLVRWGGLAAGTLALFLLSFFTAKMLFAPRGAKVAESPSAVVKTEAEKDPKTANTNEAPATVTSPPQNVQTPPPNVQPPPPQLVGRVTTAEQLLTIRIFGTDPNDEVRGTAAVRTSVEKNLKDLRDLYTGHLKSNPQSFGVVIVEFTIMPGGQVSSVVLHTTGNAGRELEPSIVSSVKQWQFPVAQGEEVKVFYPLLLSPEKIDPTAMVSYIKDVWPGRYKVLAATPVPVHTEANPSAQEVGAIGPGKFLTVVSSRDGWLGALSPKGKVGYVQQEAIAPRSDAPEGWDAKG